MLTFTLSLLFFFFFPVPHGWPPRSHAHARRHRAHTHTRSALTKPWRGRARFIAHLGCFDQWQSAALCKSLPQTELNKQTRRVCTGSDNLLIYRPAVLMCATTKGQKEITVQNGRAHTLHQHMFICILSPSLPLSLTLPHTHPISVTFAHYPP